MGKRTTKSKFYRAIINPEIFLKEKTPMYDNGYLLFNESQKMFKAYY